MGRGSNPRALDGSGWRLFLRRVPLETRLLGGFGIVVLAHEIGHAFLVRRVGASIASIELTGVGGHCEWYGKVMAFEEALIAWGGVLGQVALLLTTLTLASLSGLGESALADDLLASLTGANFALALFNLIPIPPLDGARAWRLLPIGLARIGSRLMASGKKRNAQSPENAENASARRADGWPRGVHTGWHVDRQADRANHPLVGQGLLG